MTRDKDLGPDSHSSAPSQSFNCRPGESLLRKAAHTHQSPSASQPCHPKSSHPDGIPSDTGLGYSQGVSEPGPPGLVPKRGIQRGLPGWLKAAGMRLEPGGRQGAPPGLMRHLSHRDSPHHPPCGKEASGITVHTASWHHLLPALLGLPPLSVKAPQPGTQGALRHWPRPAFMASSILHHHLPNILTTSHYVCPDPLQAAVHWSTQ